MVTEPRTLSGWKAALPSSPYLFCSPRRQRDGSQEPASPSPIAITRFTGCLLVDVNGDKRLDLVCADAYQFTIYIHVFLGNGDGTFQSPIATAVPSQSNGSWAV